MHYNCHLIYQSIDVTSDSMNRQISRQTSQASTIRRISSIREEHLGAIPQTPTIGETPDEVFPKVRKPHEKPTVMKQVCDAGTMTAPEVQEHVGANMIRRQDSTVRENVDGPVRLKELRGVPIHPRESKPQIEAVNSTFQPKIYTYSCFSCGILYYFLVKAKLA